MPSLDVSIEEMKQLAAGLKLSYRVQSDGFLLVQGEDKALKDFVRKLAAKQRAREER